MSELWVPEEGEGGGPPGLQRERTILSWNRTGVSLVVIGLLLGRFAAANPFSVRAMPSIFGIGSGIWVLWVTSFRPGGLDGASNRLRLKRTTALAIIAFAIHAVSLLMVLLGVDGPNLSEMQP